MKQAGKQGVVGGAATIERAKGHATLPMYLPMLGWSCKSMSKWAPTVLPQCLCPHPSCSPFKPHCTMTALLSSKPK